jgi:hypothetical protein
MHDRELPRLTHLQFLVLCILLSGEQSGRIIRQAIEDYGIRRSAPAFYQMMARLERDGMVEGWYGQVKVRDQAVTERRYRATVVAGSVAAFLIYASWAKKLCWSWRQRSGTWSRREEPTSGISRSMICTECSSKWRRRV